MPLMLRCTGKGGTGGDTALQTPPPSDGLPVIVRATRKGRGRSFWALSTFQCLPKVDFGDPAGSEMTGQSRTVS